MRSLRLADTLEALRRAAHDDRVKILVVKVGGSRIGLARIQELRAAILDFRAAGKPAIAWAETFGEFTQTCRTTWRPPSTRSGCSPRGRSG